MNRRLTWLVLSSALVLGWLALGSSAGCSRHPDIVVRTLDVQGSSLITIAADGVALCDSLVSPVINDDDASLRFSVRGVEPDQQRRRLEQPCDCVETIEIATTEGRDQVAYIQVVPSSDRYSLSYVPTDGDFILIVCDPVALSDSLTMALSDPIDPDDVSETPSDTTAVAADLSPEAATSARGVQAATFAVTRPDPARLDLPCPAVVAAAVCDVHRTEAGTGWLLSQVLLGTQVEILEARGTTVQVRIPDQGEVVGWVEAADLVILADEDLERFTSGARAAVVALDGIRWPEGDTLPFGSVLPLREQDGQLWLGRPDGAAVTVTPDEILTLDERPDPETVMDVVARFRPVHYREGGTSIRSMDGAALVYLVHRIGGRTIPRNEHAQQEAGESIDLDSFERGDVLFFSTPDASRIQPALALSDHHFIYASREYGLKTDQMNAYFDANLLAVRRLW